MKSNEQPHNGRDGRLREYLNMAVIIVRSFAKKLPPNVADLEELTGVAYLTVAEAMRQLKPQYTPAAARAYIRMRVNSGLIDHLRSLDLMSRKDRHILKKTQRLQTLYGHDDVGRIAAELGMTVEKLFQLQDLEARTGRHESFEEMEAQDSIPLGETGETPEDTAIQNERERIVRKAIADLDQRLGTVLTRADRYLGKEPFRVIGEALDVSESRVCQLGMQAMEGIREILRSRLDVS